MTKKSSVQEWAHEAVQTLHSSETPTLDVQVLMAFGLGQKREWLITHSDENLTDEQLSALEALLVRLQNGEPLAYITGKRAFFGLDFKITPDVLVPRPETELLVEEAINWLEAHPSHRKVVDVGTGSGIIALSLADRFNELKITGLDISQSALELAQENAALLGLAERVKWQKNDLLTGIHDRFDVIAANLPYIPSRLLDTLDVARHEPRLALDGGVDGLQLISQLLLQATSCIHTPGLILLEIEAGQGQSALTLARQAFPLAQSSCLNDYADLPRLIKIEL